MSQLEWIAAVAGVLCVALGVVRSIWTFPVAIVSVALLGIVVWRDRLYADAVLQGFFVLANLYGWRNWHGAQATTGQVMVERLSAPARWRWAIGGAGVAIVWAMVLARVSDAAYPWWDAPTAVASMVAQVLMARRKVENWAIWVAVDLALVPLYLVKGLPVVAGLYVVYFALSVWGLIDWRRVHLATTERLSGAV